MSSDPKAPHPQYVLAVDFDKGGACVLCEVDPEGKFVRLAKTDDWILSEIEKRKNQVLETVALSDPPEECQHLTSGLRELMRQEEIRREKKYQQVFGKFLNNGFRGRGLE